MKFTNLYNVRFYPQRHSQLDRQYSFLRESITGMWLSRADPQLYRKLFWSQRAVLLRDIVALILGILRIPCGIASSTKVEGRNGERRRNQGKTFRNLNNYMNPYICISSQFSHFIYSPHCDRISHRAVALFSRLYPF
jgi:hypothetical protein